MKIKMYPNLRHAHEWLLEGPLGVAVLCDLVTDYAKHFLPDFRHGSKFLMLGFESQDRITLLKDVLHHRRHKYTYGEAVTHTQNHQLCFAHVYSSVCTLAYFSHDREFGYLSDDREENSVWVGHELLIDETKSPLLRKLAINALNFGVDLFLTAHSVSQVDPFVHRYMDVIFVCDKSTRHHRLQMFEHFFHRAYENLETFEDDLGIATQNGGCLCLDQYNYQAYHYMADPTIPDFLI